MFSPSTAHSELTTPLAEPARRTPLDGWILAGIAIAVLTTIAGIASTGVNLRYFLQPTAAWIVLGGTLGVTLITTPRNALRHAVRRVLGLIRQPSTNRQELIDEIVSYVKTARIQGLLAMEPRMAQTSNSFLREMLALAIDLKSRDEFQAVLETRLRLRERQGDADAKVLEVAGGFAPAIGVIGTVVGLIEVLRQFSNMNSVALGIGTAFVSTMYGLALANLILLPAAHRIRASVAETFEIEEMILQGGLALMDNIHPSLIREQLNCFRREEPPAVKPAYYQNQSSGRDRWMVSYVDVLTILLILFVAMAAQALQSAPKPHLAAPVLAPAPVPDVKPPIPAASAAQAAIKNELEQDHLDVQLDSRGVVVSLPQALLFPPGEDRINADALQTVAAIGGVLGKIPNHVMLIGHADAVPIHNRRFGNNWELAAARGLRLLELLESSYGIAESRLSVQSYGSNDPKSTNDTPDGRASNRRVEIVILDGAPDITP